MAHDTSQTTLVLGGGPAGLTAGYLLGQAGRERARLRGGRPGRRPREDGRARRLPLRPRRPPLLHQVDRGRHALARGARRRVPAAPAHVAHLLEQPLSRLPAPRAGRDPQARPGRAAALHGVVRSRGGAARTRSTTRSRTGSRTGSAAGSSSSSSSRYTEKVWGVPTSEIRAEWAAQRIKGLSFFSAAKAAFFGNKGNKVKSLISEFNYPRFGPGQMWEAMTRRDRGPGRRGAPGRARRAHRAGRAAGSSSVAAAGETLRELPRR